jgi:hypothetical protein
MMSADYMHRLKVEAQNRSRREGVTPYLFLQAHKDGRLKPCIPFVGERVWVRDWIVADLNKLLPNVTLSQRGDFHESNIFFVDSSGWGGKGEMALTLKEFVDMAPVGFGYAVVEAGQFQVCVRAFIPPKSMQLAGVNYAVAAEREAA